MCRIGIRITGANLDQYPNRFQAALEEARLAGFSAVEIVPDDFDLIVGGRLCEDVLRKLAAILDDYRFHLSVHVPLRLNLFDREHGELHWEVLRCCAEICDRLKARILVYHPGRYIDNVDFPRYGKPFEHFDAQKKQELIGYERFCLTEMAKAFPRLMIAMENHRPYADYSPYAYAEFIDELVEVVQAIDQPNVRITLDTGHLNLAAVHYGVDPLAWAKKALPWVVHTHIHDNHGIVNFFTEKDKAGMLPFGRGDEHNMPGSGTFPFSAFFGLFSQYQGTHLIELTSRYQYPAKIRHAFSVTSGLIEDSKTGAAPLTETAEARNGSANKRRVLQMADDELNIREAVEADIPAILHLYNSLEFGDAPTCEEETALDIFRRIVNSPGRHVYVCTVHGVVVGSYVLSILEYLAHNGRSAGVLEDVVVAEGHRCAGIGRHMVAHAIDQCAAAGCYKLSLSTDIRRERAHNFYEKLGFKLHGYSFHTIIQKHGSDAREAATCQGGINGIKFESHHGEDSRS